MLSFFMAVDVVSEMEKGLELINNGYETRVTIWYHNVLFTWRWWVGLLLSLGSWIAWCFYTKRESSHRLLLAGLFVMLVSSVLDTIGMQLKGWNYPYPFLPFIPSYFPFDLAVLPVVVMFVIQWETKLNRFIKGLIFSTGTAFIGEPIFIWLGFYDTFWWEVSFSWVIYFVIYLIAKWLTKGSRLAPLNSLDII